MMEMRRFFWGTSGRSRVPSSYEDSRNPGVYLILLVPGSQTSTNFVMATIFGSCAQSLAVVRRGGWRHVLHDTSFYIPGYTYSYCNHLLPQQQHIHNSQETTPRENNLES